MVADHTSLMIELLRAMMVSSVVLAGVASNGRPALQQEEETAQPCRSGQLNGLYIAHK